MLFEGKTPFKALLMMIGAVLVVTAVSLAAVFAAQGVAGFGGFGGPHFGFPSQQQAGSALGTSVTKSAVVSRSGYSESGFYIQKTEGVYYNSSSVVAMVIENQMNSSQSAGSLESAVVSGYTAASSPVSTLKYSSVSVAIFNLTTSGRQSYFISFYTGSFFCFSLIYVYSSAQSLSPTSFAKAMVSSVV